MSESPSITSRCPQAHPDFQDTPPSRILLHDFPRRAGFSYFASPWLGRAQRCAHREDWFEALIYLWVAFNAWLALAVSRREFSDRDYYLWRAAALDPILNDRFQVHLTTDSPYASCIRELHGLLPVFKARTLHEHGLQPMGSLEHA